MCEFYNHWQIIREGSNSFPALKEKATGAQLCVGHPSIHGAELLWTPTMHGALGVCILLHTRESNVNHKPGGKLAALLTAPGTACPTIKGT